MKFASRALAALAAAGAASFTYQKLADARDRRRFPPPGRLIDIGGRRLHLVTKGEGSPTVVIIPALGESVLGWLDVADRIAADTQTCVYDRAEIGWSDPPPHWRRTPDLMAADLHALLTAAGIPPPYVVVGHSLGGIVARRFYAQRPGVVAGLVLVDSSHEQQRKRFGEADWRKGTYSYVKEVFRRQTRIFSVRRLAAGAGLLPDLAVIDDVPPEYVPAAYAMSLSTPYKRVNVGEMVMAASMKGTPDSLGSVPLTVLTALKRLDESLLAAWVQMQNELAALSTDTVHITAPEAGHYMHVDDPDLVVQAIRDLVDRCRDSGR